MSKNRMVDEDGKVYVERKKKSGCFKWLIIFIVGCFSYYYIDENENVKENFQDIINIITRLFNEDVESNDKDNSSVLFESDEMVNEFFMKYNEVAEDKEKVSKVRRGNIATKGIVNSNQAELVVINVEELYMPNKKFHDIPVYSVSYSFPKEENIEQYQKVFKNIIKSRKSDISDIELVEHWEQLMAIESAGSDDEYIMIKDIRLEFFSKSNASYGNESYRIDFYIPY